MKALGKKLLAVQAEIGGIKKSAENPFFNSMYFDINALLDVVKPVMQKHGLLILQPLMTSSAGVGGVSTIIMDPESGERIQSDMPLPPITDPQKVGSAITYFRRYSLQSMLGLQAEDDDSNLASGKTKPSVKPKGKAASF